MVATDASCYMGWIAGEYGLQLPREYTIKGTCLQGTGDKGDLNKAACR